MYQCALKMKNLGGVSAYWWTDALQQRSLYQCALKILVGVSEFYPSTDALQQRSQFQETLKRQ